MVRPWCEFYGVCCTIMSGNLIIGVVPTSPIGQTYIRWTDVCPVEHNHSSKSCYLRVHRGNAGILYEELPTPIQSSCYTSREYQYRAKCYYREIAYPHLAKEIYYDSMNLMSNRMMQLRPIISVRVTSLQFLIRYNAFEHRSY
jgi:hypothetical protein